MPRQLGEQLFYTASEVAQMAGVHRLTLLRWIREGKLTDVQRDRNGWRVFSQTVADEVVDFAKGFARHQSPNQQLLFSRRELLGKQTGTNHMTK